MMRSNGFIRRPSQRLVYLRVTAEVTRYPAASNTVFSSDRCVSEPPMSRTFFMEYAMHKGRRETGVTLCVLSNTILTVGALTSITAIPGGRRGNEYAHALKNLRPAALV